jgi:hypothetical protein
MKYREDVINWNKRIATRLSTLVDDNNRSAFTDSLHFN